MTSIDHEPPRLSESEVLERALRWAKLILGIVGTVGGWALGLTVWLVAMHADVAQLKRDNEEVHKTIIALDSAGTRALETVRNRQMDVVAANSSQDARIREMEVKLSDIQRRQVENSFWIDQLVAFMRSYSHAPIPQQQLRPPLTTVPP